MNINKTAIALWFVIALGTAGATAQTASTPDAQPMRAKITERFAAADANHDGKLTREEAEASMPIVARNFDQIDKAHKGFVTLDDIQAFYRERMAARRAAKAAATTD
jgi:EF hand